LLQQQLLDGGSLAGAGGPATSEEASKQLGLQQAQLQRLRQVRDDLLKAHDGWAARTPGDGNVSPRELQVHRRCTFLAAQLQALLQHTTELEALIDDGTSTNEAEETRLKSAKRISEQSQKSFDEFSEKLHTLEVQKADVDQELRRLQQRFTEQESQLRGVQRHRDQLLVEAGSSPGGKAEDDKKMDNSDADSSASGIPVALSAGFLFDGARPNELRASPKDKKATTAKLKKGVRTMVSMHQMTGTEATKLRAQGLSPTRPRPNPLVFSMTARPSITFVDAGNRRKSQEDHQRAALRQKEEKGARREKKDKDGRHHKETDHAGLRKKMKDKHKGEGGNCETQ
jgi:hypothetical protein